jgi:hypothetical protein
MSWSYYPLKYASSFELLASSGVLALFRAVTHTYSIPCKRNINRFRSLNIYTHPDGSFGPILPPGAGNMLDPWCNISFGIPALTGGPKNVKWLELDEASLMAMTNLIVTEGLQDPYYAMSLRPSAAGVHTSKEARYLPMVGGAHVADLLKEDPNYSASILSIRARELVTMRM